MIVYLILFICSFSGILCLPFMNMPEDEGGYVIRYKKLTIIGKVILLPGILYLNGLSFTLNFFFVIIPKLFLKKDDK